MALAVTLGQLGQVAITVDDIDVAERFYGDQLGLRKLYRFGDMVFFDMAGVRLLVEREQGSFTPASSVLYFRVADLGLAVRTLTDRGVPFTHPPHLIAPMADHDLWMAFFRDPAGNVLALMQEAPKGYAPVEPAPH